MNTDTLILLGIGLVLTGLVLVIAGSLLAGSGDNNVKAGGVIFIGPIPIVFGSSKKMAGLSLLIGLAILLTYLFLYRR